MKHVQLFSYFLCLLEATDDFHSPPEQHFFSASSLLEQLIALISAAKQHNVEFIYAISPGLDLTFSNPKEVAALKRKLDQVGL